MKKKYLPLYEKWLADGQLPENGLCNCFGSPEGPDTPNVKYDYQDFLLMMPGRIIQQEMLVIGELSLEKMRVDNSLSVLSAKT